MSQAILITDENFEREVLDSELPVLVDFWAEWCGPCRALGPVVQGLAEEYGGRMKVVKHGGRMKVAKLSVDDNPYTASTYGISSIPTLIIFRDGIEKNRILGALPKRDIVDVIEGTLGHKLTA